MAESYAIPAGPEIGTVGTTVIVETTDSAFTDWTKNKHNREIITKIGSQNNLFKGDSCFDF